MRMPIRVLILSGIDAVLAGLALYGGINLLLDPSGASIGLDPALAYIPYVADFMPFALWLVVVFAAFPAVLVYGLVTDRKWALIGSFALGALELVWIITQVVLLYPMGFTFWWPLIAGMGVVSLYLVITPTMRTFYHFGAAGRGPGTTGRH